MTSGKPSYDVAFYVPLIGFLLKPGAVFPPGGAETQIYLLARELAASGHRVCFVSYEVPALPGRVDQIDVISRPPARWRTIKGAAGQMAEIATLWKTVASVDARTFVQRGSTPETGLVALAAKSRGRRFVYSSANDIDFDWGSVASRKNAALFDLGVRLADQIVVQTSVQARLCRDRFGREPIMIRSLVDPAQPRSAKPEAFLWIGKLASYKRPLKFVELAKAVPEARFWMVGVPSEKDSPRVAAELERRARGLRNLELLAPRPRHELMQLVERSIAIVSTSEYEGMANVILEGWARGIPALVLSHDADGLIASEGLGACAGGSRRRLADLTREFWLRREHQQELSDRCRAYVRGNHAPNAVAARWVEVLGLAERDPPEVKHRRVRLSVKRA